MNQTHSPYPSIFPACEANWQAPSHIGCLSTTCAADLNRLKNTFQLPSEPIWLEQTHSTLCIRPDDTPNRKADAQITNNPSTVLAIKTADCMPIMLCNRLGNEIAGIHAGWRGLLNGIVQNTLNTMDSNPNDIIAWIGPSICKRCFEVGPEVVEAFTRTYPFAKQAFTAIKQNKSFGDLSAIAGQILNQYGIDQIYFSNLCTFEEKNRFYSYRREKQTGRIASLIWFKA